MGVPTTSRPVPGRVPIHVVGDLHCDVRDKGGVTRAIEPLV